MSFLCTSVTLYSGPRAANNSLSTQTWFTPTCACSFSSLYTKEGKHTPLPLTAEWAEVWPGKYQRPVEEVRALGTQNIPRARRPRAGPQGLPSVLSCFVCLELCFPGPRSQRRGTRDTSLGSQHTHTCSAWPPRRPPLLSFPTHTLSTCSLWGGSSTRPRLLKHTSKVS